MCILPEKAVLRPAAAVALSPVITQLPVLMAVTVSLS
jgi:hypothetical protein